MKRPAEIVAAAIALAAGKPVAKEPVPLPDWQETADGYYSLACYRGLEFEGDSEATKSRDLGLGYLAEALLRGDPAMKRAARQDRALKSLAGERFDELTGEPSATPAPAGFWAQLWALLAGLFEEAPNGA